MPPIICFSRLFLLRRLYRESRCSTYQGSSRCPQEATLKSEVDILCITLCRSIGQRDVEFSAQPTKDYTNEGECHNN